MPPELVRKGRFDEIFFVDLPSRRIRTSIFAIHLSQRGQSLKNFDIEKLSLISTGFSGAEIEQVVVSALYAAHAKEQSLSTEHLELEIKQTKPLSVLMEERISALRQWAAKRTVPCD
jgi:SpoVK/Ycf46/Vps4 family AAA+-type ATPase